MLNELNKESKLMNIGSLHLDNPFILAPMAGISDASMRRICSQQGASLTYSEMVSAKGIYYGDKKTERLLYIYEDEGPVAFQIFGHEPEVMAYAAEYLEKYKNAVLDINMGCPVPKVVKNGDGSALMRDPEQIYKVVEAVTAKTKKPVTVKIRLGFTEQTKNAVEVAKAIEAAGASAVAVHGRTREQFYSGTADWDAIGEVKAALSIPVIGNGDVDSPEAAEKLMRVSGCDFIMVGRATKGNPWIFAELKAAWEGRNVDEGASYERRRNMMIRQLHELCELKGEYAAVREMRAIAGWYLHGTPGGAKVRAKINHISDVKIMEELIKSLWTSEYIYS